MNASDPDGLVRLAAIRRRCGWLFRIRPQSMATPLFKLFSPYERRMIARVDGLSLFLDPLSHLAGTILSEGTFEADTAAIFRAGIKPGDTVLDIGANEGFFSALAARLAGPAGTVIAVEPQQRLQDVLRINLALNGTGTTHVCQCAIGAESGGTVELSLAPPGNTGSSSILNRYRWGGGVERVPVRSVPEILDELAIDRVDFVKVDVEGYESQVVPSLMPLLEAGRIGTLLLDYHAAILQAAGVDPRMLHAAIVGANYEPVSREDATFSGYILYRQAS